MKMTALAWIGVMFILAVLLRAKIFFLGKSLVPACVIAGVVGFAFMNTTGLGGSSSADYSYISGQLYTFLFINMGITLAAKKDQAAHKTMPHRLSGFREKIAGSMFSGILGMGSFWALAYSFQALIGFGLLCLIGQYWGMDPTYGLLISFGFAQGPGQAVTYGIQMEAAGWSHAVQVGITFASMGFLVAFIFGVPYAKRGIKMGIASSSVRLGDDVALGFYEPEKQENYGKLTTFGGNLDVLTFHVALVGVAWIMGIYVGKLWGFFPGYFGRLFSQLLFFNGMLCAYALRWFVGRFGLLKYLDRGTQIRIGALCTDLMVASAFMAIDMQIVGKWMVPILIICVVASLVTWYAILYFGARFGGSNDFERILGEWGTATGTNATGLSLVRIVDPEAETTTAAELGPANIVNVPASYFVMPAILAYSARSMSRSSMIFCLVAVLVSYLVFMRVVGVWGKKTFDMAKGEKYQDGKLIMKDGKTVA
ncbi:sodium:glutamate symporter [Pyramidobacter sp. C12-8]|nr:sodium:glutamate symporter [Pyramidobacter sp. C12-8]